MCGTMKYDFYTNPFFKVYATVENGHVNMHTSGLASKAVKPLLSDMLYMFDGSKPALVNGDSLVFSTWMPPIPGRAFDRLVSSQMGYMRGKMVPEQVTISITEECPNRCLHCALPDTNNRTSLSPEIVKNAIDQCLEIGSTLIIFDGGEPLLYNGLEDLINYVDNEKAISGMFTSGVGLDFAKALALKEAGLNMLSVSLDSAFEANHDRMRGRTGVYRAAISAIENALDVGLMINIYVVISPSNIDELDDFYQLAKDMGVHEITFFEIVPTGRWFDHKDDLLSSRGMQKFNDFIERSNNMDGPRVFSVPHVLRKMGCFAGKKWLHITPEGNVSPCACIPISVGNIHEEKISRIWDRIRKDSVYKAKTCLMRDDNYRNQYVLK
ncbi:Radical SAM domain protein [Methanohalophilus mahii DSM 5219]|uniref:Radical SAM domain protein n=2 Tax=Methanohalophilus mahii TaxID=2176 RepID=D5EAK0_METMS|nr:Radical SAM domain protein [Methanohalophilus mahii DSM 5219]